MSADSQLLYERWVLAVIPKLRELPDGDGAFAALSIAFGLYERFIDSKLSKEKVKATPENFNEEAAKDMGLQDDGADVVSRFWNGFRLGMQHAFQPKAYIEKEGRGNRWGWEIAEGSGYEFYPRIIRKESDLFIVKIDPWKFLSHVLKRWEENSELMNQLSEFQCGCVEQNLQTHEQVSPNSSGIPYPNNQTKSANDFQPPTTGIYPTKR